MARPIGFQLCILLLLTRSRQASTSPTCLTPTQIKCLLKNDECNAAADNDGQSNLLATAYPNATQHQILIGRVRFPGTASTHEADMFKMYEITKSRYDGLGDSNGCGGESRLCLDADGKDASLALDRFHQSGWGSHAAYDVVSHSLQAVLDADGNEGGPHILHPEPFLMTTLREPGSYSHKWYAYRNTWDKVVDLRDTTYEEWVDMVPWRMNVLTRMLASNADREVMPKNLIYTKEGETGDGLRGKAHSDSMEKFVADEYMKEQNRLGPGESEVYKLALERLAGMVHFSLFHRLTESWQLLEHTFCWNMGYQTYRPDKEITGFDSVKAFVVKSGGSVDAATRIWKVLKERNRLDLALMEEAEKMFEERLATMKREKADGIICNFLGRVKITCASGDDVLDEKVR